MTIKYFVCILILGSAVAYSNKSFVLVTDTTASMSEEIDILKRHINSVMKDLPPSATYENFILVPFSEPADPNTSIFTTPDRLIHSLNYLEVKGGYDCPENSLTAVEAALEVSKDNSIIFLFTDAPPKDFQRLPFVHTMCRNRQSQVVIFLTGDCPEDAPNNIHTYKEIAKVCSGIVFNLDVQELFQVFKYMKAVTYVEWSNVYTHDEFMGTKQFNFAMDKYTKEVIVAVAGDSPNIQLTKGRGEMVTAETIMETAHALVIRVAQAELGQYTTEVYSRGTSRVTFYKCKTLEFRYGFSPKKPRSLEETTTAPIPDATSYLVIEQLDSDLEWLLLKLQLEDNQNPQLEVLDNAQNLYVAQAFFKAEKPFRITINGRLPNSYEIIEAVSKVIVPQAKVPARETTATVEAIKLNSTLIEFTSNTTLFCKVSGDPKPDIWWEDDNANRIDSEDAFFEWPMTYISYATIFNATSNSTIYCKAKNFAGESSMSAELYVHREFTFEVLQNPSDTVIEYDTEGKLYCKVKAYPEATVKWYHNDTAVENSDNVEIIPEDNMLLIKRMNMESTGEYKCDISNDVESRTFTAVIDISGLDPPTIEIIETELTIKPGDGMEIECNVVKGNPVPVITWKKQVDEEFVDVPDGVSVEGNSLKISSANLEHRGVYICEATNIQGADAKEVTVKIHYPPKIRDGDDNINVEVGNSVQLLCDVDAEPKATVHWEMYQGDVILPFDRSHNTDDHYTHRFIARRHDTGTYHCIADNGVGRAERKVTVNILETPYIEPLNFRSLTVRSGDSVQVTCNVLIGQPVPSTRWEFISPKSSVRVLSRQTTTKLVLHLTNVSKANEGSYQCIADNEHSVDFIKFNLIIQ